MLVKIGCYTVWSEIIQNVKCLNGVVDENSNTESFTINIQVTDGHKCWILKGISYTHVSNQRQLPWSELQRLIIDALTLKDVRLAVVLKPAVGDSGSLNLKITEDQNGLKFVVLLVDLLLCTDNIGGINDMFDLAAEYMKKQSEEILRVKLSESLIKLSMQNLQNDLDTFVKGKDDLRTELMRDMCVLLNLKGQEISRLRALLDHQDDGNEGLSDNESIHSNKSIGIVEVPTLSPKVSNAKGTKVSKSKELSKSKVLSSSSSSSSSSLLTRNDTTMSFLIPSQNTQEIDSNDISEHLYQSTQSKNGLGSIEEIFESDSLHDTYGNVSTRHDEEVGMANNKKDDQKYNKSSNDVTQVSEITSFSSIVQKKKKKRGLISDSDSD